MGNAVRELKEMTPLPMNTMLDKETRESALDARQKRKKMVVKNVPPTTPCKYTRVFYGLRKKQNVMQLYGFPGLKNKIILFLRPEKPYKRKIIKVFFTGDRLSKARGSICNTKINETNKQH